MEATRDERSEHVVRRLESFSDIVIGFALAQTALTLVIPAKPASFFTDPVGIVGYLMTFALVARFWWSHSEIFRVYFTPSPLSILLNFAALASLGLFVFSLQLVLRQGQMPVDQAAMARSYFVLFALTYGLLAVLRIVGLLTRDAYLSAKQRMRGWALSVRSLCIVGGALLGAFASPFTHAFANVEALGSTHIATVPLGIALGVVVGSIVGRIASAVLEKRSWERPARA